MKIGIDARFYGPTSTGIGRYVAELIRHLAPLDQDNHYTVFLNSDNYHSFQLPNSRWSKIKTIDTYYDTAEQTIFLRDLYRAQLDLMHFPHFNAPILYRRPYVITIHDLTPFFYPGRKNQSLFRRQVFKHIFFSNVKHAKKVFTVSQHTAQDLSRHLGIPPEKIIITPNAVGTEWKQAITDSERKRIKEKYQLPPHFLFYYGVMRDHKNLPLLVEALQLLKNKNIQIPLLLAGHEDPLYPEVRQLRQHYQLQDQIHFIGFVPDSDLRTILSLATALTFPSLYEGFGIPPLEAMTLGTPVICSSASSLPEVVGEAALLFDPHSPSQLATQIEKLLHSPELRAELIRKGKAQIQKFSWDDMAHTVLREYNKLK